MTRPADPATDLSVSTLANGVRVLLIAAPQGATAAVSVFVRSGSAHETAALNGISHMLEHMVFKGTSQRDARQINVDAERLGAQVDAHTDKDHTAFHMQGLPDHVPDLIRMLGDLVCRATLPADELERERQVLLHELTDDEDDPVSLAYRLFDQACYGVHAMARPVIGSRRNLERLTRDDLLAFTRRQYSGANVVVAAIGPLDPARVLAAAQEAFGALPAGTVNTLAAPPYLGGLRLRAQSGSSQSHLVLGFPIADRAAEDPVNLVAAAVFGEGMSSPLLHELREQRGLVYHAACSADVMDGCGQFVVEATTGPDKLDAVLQAVVDLLLRHAEHVDPVDLQRARHQIAVRLLLAQERPLRRLEAAALDVFALGAPRSAAVWAERIASVSATQVSAAFGRMFAAGPALAVAGRVPRGTGERARKALAAVGGPPV